MNLSRFAVERPVFTSMVALIVVVLGVVALSRIRIDMLPEVEVPTLSVRTGYEGADPEVIERQVTQIIEEIVATVPGVTSLSSDSSEGRSDIKVTFAWGTDLDAAATDVRARLEEELSELPDDIDRPQLRKFDIASFPVVLLGISSDTLSPLELNDLAEVTIRNRFARLPGVAQVDLWGGYQREVRVEIDPNRSNALGLSAQDVIDALRGANIDLPAGSIIHGRYEVVLRAPSELNNLEAIRQVVVAVKDGGAITVGQLATVLETNERSTRIIRVNGQQGIRVAIRKEADANTVEVARAILEAIDSANDALPQVNIVPVINQGNFIERSIKNVAQSVLYGGALAIIILLFFLRSLRSTVIIGLAIPLSILMTMAIIFSSGLTLNMMTLGGLALGVGMMVDSSIVVLENIFRRRVETNDKAHDASINGSSEVAGAIIASTITTLVIFLPLVFVEGVSGLLFKELALVVVFSLIASLLVALTLVPMLCAKVYKKNDTPTNAPQDSTLRRLVAKAESGQRAIENYYRDLLQSALMRPLLAVIGSAVLLGLSCLLWPLIGSEFMPPSDEGEVRVKGTFEPGFRLDKADTQSRTLESIVKAAAPEIQSVVTSVNASGRGGDAAAESDIRLNVGTASTRKRSNSDIANAIRKASAGQVAGVEIRVRAPQGQFLLERLLGGDDGLSVDIKGYDWDTMNQIASRITQLIEQVPGVSDVDNDIVAGIPQEHIIIDRMKVADVGLRVRDVAEALESALAGKIAGDYRPPGESMVMRVQLAGAETMDLNTIKAYQIMTPRGESINLGNVIRTQAGDGPAEITRKDQQRTISLEVNLAGRDAGSVARDIQAVFPQVLLPPGYSMAVTGTYEEQEKAFREMVLSFLLALVLVYMVLACQYESLRDPIVVMFAVPVAAIGVLVTLYITKSTMNIQSGIGCIMLGGIVVNNAILLVDQAGRLRREGLLTMDALVEAGRRRLRPILMTTATTILGLLPLSLGIGEGADAQAPLARAVIGGLVASTLITLFLVPAIYRLIHPPHALKEGTAP